MNNKFSVLLIIALLIIALEFWEPGKRQAVVAQSEDTQTPAPQTTSHLSGSPSELIDGVNSLRLSQGLNALTIHPVLMEVAALQARALAVTDGAVGHQRPCGLTLGQQLLMMGFPLWGDLSLDGYRSENWTTASTTEDAIQSWLGDDLHANTMLSPDRSDIGAAVVTSPEGQQYFVLETALRTNTGQHQTTAYDILTGIPMTQTVCAGYTSGDISQYSVPVVVNTALPDGDVIHQVQYGQTLWSIAIQYNTTIAEIRRLNNLPDDTISPGWKLLIHKGATQPPPVMDAPIAQVTSTETPYPTAIPFYTTTPKITVTPSSVPLGQQIKQNRIVFASLLVAFSVLLAGIIGFGRKRDS